MLGGAGRVDMLHGSLAKNILRFALPLIATSLLALAYNAEGFLYAFHAGFGQTCLTFTSQNPGARQPERFDRVRRWCLLFSIGFGALLSAAVLLRPLWIFTLFRAHPTPVCLFLCHPVIWVVVITGQAIGTYAARRRAFARIRAEKNEEERT